jgi:hypothetical protein
MLLSKLYKNGIFFKQYLFSFSKNFDWQMINHMPTQHQYTLHTSWFLFYNIYATIFLKLGIEKKGTRFYTSFDGSKSSSN